MLNRVPALANLVAADAPRSDLDRRIAHLEGQLVFDRAVAAGLGVRPLGVAPLFSEPKLVADGSYWIVLPADRDPLVRAGLPMPIQELARLQTFATAVDASQVQMFVAHELLEPDFARLARGDRVRVRALVPQKTRRLEAERAASLIGRAATAVSLAAAAPLLLAGLATGLVAGAAVGLAAAGASVTTLDPVVLGAVALDDTDDQLALWLALAAWDW